MDINIIINTMEGYDKWIKGTIYGLATIGSLVIARSLARPIRSMLKRPVPLQKVYGENTWAMITGGSKGIGYEFARQLGKKGFNILIVDKSNSANQKAVKELSEYCGDSIKVRSITGDILDSQEIEKVACENDISILINNAGIA